MYAASVLSAEVSAAVTHAFGPAHEGTDPVLRPSQHADVQANVALPLAKRLGRPPREVAAQIVAHLDVSDVCSSVEVSGPGFLNLTLRDDWVTAQVNALAVDPRLGIPTQPARRVVIDYSHPNVAKEMHVGHLRTTVVGDALARVLERLGHDVVRQNHIGDWGTPFGMLIEHLLDVGEHSDDALVLRSDPNAFYRAARASYDGDEEFAVRARQRVVLMQAGDPDTLRLWGELVGLSRDYFHRVYDRLGVTLTDADLAGESTYNPMLGAVCDDLEAAGIAVVSEGALCVFLDGHTGRDGEPLPLIVRKSDGGYGYVATDLAAIRHRIETLGADRVLYVIGAPQALHLRMVWEAAHLAGWLPDPDVVVHVRIGNVLGDDRKILRTRSGAPLRLGALLDEAVAAARLVVHVDVDVDADADDVARQVGIGSVKYADLSVAHDSEYVFDLDRMVSLKGNTGHYLQYAAARVGSIFRKGGIDPAGATAPITVTAPAERALALALLDLGEVVQQVGETCEPHRLCAYLFDLAQTFTTFYDQCPVLKADGDVRASRLALCRLTRGTLVTGLGLLGIEAPERM